MVDKRYPLEGRIRRYPDDEVEDIDIEDIDIIDVARAKAGCHPGGKMPTSDFEPSTVFVFDEDDEYVGVEEI